MTISASKLSDSLSQLQQLFTKVDKNTDNKLSKTEFATAAKGIAGLSRGSEAETANIFTQMDTNGDGNLTKTELTSGIDLADKVKEALLMAQELMSGKGLLEMLGNNSTTGNNASSSLFGAKKEDSSVPGSMNLADMLDKNADTSSTDPYTSMLQQVIAKYNAAAASQPAGTGTATTKPLDTTA